MKGKKESSERRLNEIEASQLSDIEFKTMVIRKLNELSVNYQKNTGKLQRTYYELHQHEKDIETINKGQEEIKNTISELKNTVEGIKRRLDKAEDRISELDDKVEKNTQKEQEKEKRLERTKSG